MAKKIMRKFTINEISAVDIPAQSGARTVIMKRSEDITKRIKLTTSVEGHSHLIDDSLNYEGGETSWNKSEEEEYGHSHPWVRNSDGSITIGESEGHTHKIVDNTWKKNPPGGPDDANPTGSAGGKTKENSMTSEVEKAAQATADKAVADLALVQKQLATAIAVSELNDVAKAHYQTLNAEQKEAFLAKSAAERTAELEALKSADPVVYKAANGMEFRKSDDPRLVAMAEESDKNAKLAKAAQEDAANAVFAKRAQDELKHLPGDEVVKVAVLKAIDGIADEAIRTKATEMLKANDAGLSEALKTRGVGKSSVEAGDAETKLNNLAKKHQEANAGMSFEKAFTAVTETAEGKDLYEQIMSK